MSMSVLMTRDKGQTEKAKLKHVPAASSLAFLVKNVVATSGRMLSAATSMELRFFGVSRLFCAAQWSPNQSKHPLHTRTRQAMAGQKIGWGWLYVRSRSVFVLKKNMSTNTGKQGPALARDRGQGVSVSFHKVINPIRVQTLEPAANPVKLHRHRLFCKQRLFRLFLQEQINGIIIWPQMAAQECTIPPA
jgi:hypothetical protein